MKITLMHEIQENGQHRIVAVAEDGTNSVGKWAPAHELAQHLGLFGNTDYGNGLPPGIFQVKERPHQVLA